MTIIVEDGTIVANANSYVDHTSLAAFALERGVTISAVQADREVLLFKAMDYLARYANQWKGERVDEDQELEWPRANVVLYGSGPYLPITEIPAELKNAQMALAMAAVNTTILPTATTDSKGPIIEETVHGAVTVRYANNDRVLPVASDSTADTFLRVLLRNSGLSVVRI